MTYSNDMKPVDFFSPVRVNMAIAAFTGAGAAAPTVTPTAGLPIKANLAAPRSGNTTTITRNGAGDYTFVFQVGRSPGAVLQIIPTVEGTTANLVPKIAAWSIASGRLTVQVLVTADVVADDLEAVDILRLFIIGVDSSAAS